MIFKRLKAVFDFYLYSNIHIALCAVAMVFVTQLVFGFHLRAELFIFVFCGTFFLYNLQRLPSAFTKSIIESEFKRHKWNTEHKVFLAMISALAAIAAAWSFFQLYHRSQIIALLPALLSFAYAFPFIPWKGKWKQLRDFKVLKIFIVSIVWGIIISLLPAAANNSSENWFTPAVFCWFLACCGLIFSITVPFDIRDLHYDGEKLKTLPAMFGVKQSILISIVVLAISDALVFICTTIYGQGGIKIFIAFSVWSLVTGVFIAKSNPKRPEYYFSFFVDGLMILLLGFLLLASYIK